MTSSPSSQSTRIETVEVAFDVFLSDDGHVVDFLISGQIHGGIDMLFS